MDFIRFMTGNYFSPIEIFTLMLCGQYLSSGRYWELAICGVLGWSVSLICRVIVKRNPSTSNQPAKGK